MKVVRSLLLFTIMVMMILSSSIMVFAEEGAAEAECSSSEDGTTTCSANQSHEPESGATNNHSNNSQQLDEKDPNCPARPHIIKCAGAHLDLNQNGKLERAELQSAIDSLPWYARGILNILGSVDKMMKKCDIDGDDAIGMDYDMSHNQETCLATCLKRRVFKGAFFPKCDL